MYFELDTRDTLADDNLDAQKRFVREMRAARINAGKTVEDVAKRLGISSELYEDIEASRRGLSFTEIRRWALSLDVFVSYRVTPNASSIIESHRETINKIADLWSEEDEPARDPFEKSMSR